MNDDEWPTQIGDRCPQAVGVVAKRTYSPIAGLAQESTYFSGCLIVVDGKALDSPLVATFFWPPTNGALAALLNEHNLVGAQRDAVVDSPLCVQAGFSVAVVIPLVTSQFVRMGSGLRIPAPF